MVLDRFFRPGEWAAKIAFRLGLQTGKPIHIDRHRLPTPRISGVPPLRIAFASDFHAGATTSPKLLDAACDALDSLAPDILLLGGDFVTVRAAYISELAAPLARVRAPLGKFGVFGNHDLRADRASLVSALEAAGVQMLVNQSVRLPAPHDDVIIGGLDDPISGDPDGGILDGAAEVRLVLMHAPDGLIALGNRSFALALCGHTHGGQIAMPGGAMPYLPHGQLSRKYSAGWYSLPSNGGSLLVSRGVGCSTIPIRLFSPAEVHLITIG
jgi:predicted MPP superfamily phosphohydrolase